MTGALIAGLLLQVWAWMDRYPDLEALSDTEGALVALAMLAEIGAGVAAIALLPLVIGHKAKPGRRAGIVAAVIILASMSSLAAPAALIALGAVASWLHRGWLIAACASMAVAFGLVAVLDPSIPALIWEYININVLLCAIVVLIGMSFGRRRVLLESLHDRAEALEREQAAVVAQTQLAERTRIAREMHDTLSHRLALISLHAGGLSVHPDKPEVIEETARVIQEAAHAASNELRAVLTVLRDDQHDVRLDVSLADLADAVRLPGVDVRLTVDEGVAGRLGEVAPSASRALARVVTEGIANAVKHAPGRPIAVRVAGTPGERASVRVTNPLGEGSGLAGGYGLIGLRERIALAGGQLNAGRDGSDFVLTAWVPWT